MKGYNGHQHVIRSYVKGGVKGFNLLTTCDKTGKKWGAVIVKKIAVHLLEVMTLNNWYFAGDIKNLFNNVTKTFNNKYYHGEIYGQYITRRGS